MCRPEKVFHKVEEKSELPPLAFTFATKGLRVLLRERGLLKPDGSMDHAALEAAMAGEDARPDVARQLAQRAYWLLANAKPRNDGDGDDEWRAERMRWCDDFDVMTGE